MGRLAGPKVDSLLHDTGLNHIKATSQPPNGNSSNLDKRKINDAAIQVISLGTAIVSFPLSVQFL